MIEGVRNAINGEILFSGGDSQFLCNNGKRIRSRNSEKFILHLSDFLSCWQRIVSVKYRKWEEVRILPGEHSGDILYLGEAKNGRTNSLGGGTRLFI